MDANAIETMASGIKGAITDGFGIATSFGSMISNTFNNLFIVQSGTNAGQPNSFAIVALTLTGVAIVTGIAMKVFNKFMGGQI